MNEHGWGVVASVVVVMVLAVGVIMLPRDSVPVAPAPVEQLCHKFASVDSTGVTDIMQICGEWRFSGVSEQWSFHPRRDTSALVLFNYYQGAR